MPVGPYVVDFCCRERKLIVELDGGQHAAQAAYDARRTVFLVEQGYRVLRFWDNEALGNRDGVLQRVAEALGSPSPRPSPQRGEGEGRQPSPPKGRETNPRPRRGRGQGEGDEIGGGEGRVRE
jgi:hypothetical protein